MTTGEWVLVAGLSIGSIFLSVGVAGSILVRLPADYFKGEEHRKASPRPLIVTILKNLAGALIVLVGLVMAIPGVPGNGTLMILAGLLLLDVPGKYRLERKLISLRPIRVGANRLRAWRGRPPFEFPR